MNIPSKDEFRNLMMPQSGTCISIVLSTHRMGVEMQSDPLKLRNTIRTVEKRLHESGLHSTQELLKPIQALLDEKEFWQYAGDGLVIFRSVTPVPRVSCANECHGPDHHWGPFLYQAIAAVAG